MMSSYDDEYRAASAPSAARVGADLRAARERLGWTLPAIAGHLRIRLPFLEAIEDGRTADLPGNAYAVGFIRTYAQAIGLDADEIARRFRAEAAEANRKTELNFPAPVPDRGVPAGAIVLVGALLAIGAYVGWYRISGNSHPAADVVASVPERLAPLADKVVPLAPPASLARSTFAADPPPPAISPSSAAAAVAPGGFAQVQPALTVGPAPVAPSGAAATLALATPLPSVQSPTPQSPVVVAAPATPPAAEVARIDGPRIVLRAKADAWMQVRDKGGQVLLNRVLRNGESWQVPAKPSLLLTTGNAAGTELLVDGVATASLGGDGAVRRDLPLDPDAIKEGKLAVAGPAGPPAPAQVGPITAPKKQ